MTLPTGGVTLPRIALAISAGGVTLAANSQGDFGGRGDSDFPAVGVRVTPRASGLVAPCALAARLQSPTLFGGLPPCFAMLSVEVSAQIGLRNAKQSSGNRDRSRLFEDSFDIFEGDHGLRAWNSFFG